MKINLTYKLLTITLIVLAGNGLLGFAFYKINQTVLVSEHWVQHTDEVLNASASVLAMSRDMETASAGFVITQDRSFLDPLYTAQKTIFNSLLRLRKLTLDNPRQQKRIDSLEADLKNGLFVKNSGKAQKASQGPGYGLYIGNTEQSVYRSHPSNHPCYTAGRAQVTDKTDPNKYTRCGKSTQNYRCNIYHACRTHYSFNSIYQQKHSPG